MDSVTQAALGAVVAGAVAGKQCNAKVLLAGAALGTLPDLDVVLSYGDPVTDMVKHRGFSHSLLILFPLSLLLAKLCHLWLTPSWSFKKLLVLISAVLITHPLLDAFTTYGTQLLWPFEIYFAVSSIFIIDPLYTLPLLLVILMALWQRDKAASRCRAGLVVTTLYLAWSIIAMGMIESRTRDSLVELGYERDQPLFLTPTPFNTVLWRIVVLDDEQYLEGLASLLDSDPKVDFLVRERGSWPFAHQPDVLQAQLKFAGDYVRYQVDEERVVVADLRMGIADFLSFQFQYATMDDLERWQQHTPFALNGLDGAELYLPKLLLRLMGDQSLDADLCRNCNATES
ncbi:metal-dependent hydrolase [Thaumasiovibrio subtropicus]|uniref:metal-dependent hydrolase n=1 Tax=Thaumasiovibrio subtropicus TaxID=1891207 RepID=UPI000B34C8A9|nr:metal-dependent hydrolase [Thaumasiovibrio subtropicus]